MRQWRLIWASSVLLCAPAYSETTARAVIAVSVQVQDRCLVHAASRSAACSGNATYDVGISRERLAVAGELTDPAGYEQKTVNGSEISFRTQAAAGAGRAPWNGTVEATQVTYSF